jgi:hypothetical protein
MVTPGRHFSDSPVNQLLPAFVGESLPFAVKGTDRNAQ